MGQIAYKWNSEGLYTGPIIARNKDKYGMYMLPGCSTWEKPPEPRENEIVVREDDSWIIKPDFRDKLYYDTELSEGNEFIKHTITDIGKLPEKKWTEKEPKPHCVWNGTDWEFDRELWLDDVIRPERNYRLKTVDVVYCNADKWERMSEEKKQEWRAYKQKLRDLPETIDIEDPQFPQMPKEELRR